MKIVVCIRRTPSTDTRIQIAPDGRHIQTAGVTYVLNPYDEYAVEEGIRKKEAHGGEVIVVTVGPAEAAKELKQALAMGADRAVRIEPPAGVDSAATAAILAEVIRDLEPDLVLCGKMAVDEQDSQVPMRLATKLGWPAASFVTGLEIADGRARIRTQTEMGVITLEAPLPVVVAVDKAINEPRYPGIRGIMAAKKKPIDERPAPAVEPRVEVKELALPPPRKPGRIVGEGVAAVPELVRLLREEAKVL